MVYQQKLVAVIKYNGKILREVDNTVSIPFLAEYEIFIKNLESRDVVINISIDGEDVLDGQTIVIRANSSYSLEGFLKGNKVTNKFKFIQKTEKIQNYRGDRVDDGLIRIEYRFTKINQTITTHYVEGTHWHHPFWCDCPRCRPYRIVQYPIFNIPYYSIAPLVNYGGSSSGTVFTMPNAIPSVTAGTSDESLSGVTNHSQFNCGNNISNNIGGQIGANNPVLNSVNANAFIPQFDEGITVKGSESDQKLQPAWTSPLEDQSYTIILKLKGSDKNDVPLEKPILVSTKVKCSTCGHNNKSNIKYCPECGTALV